VTHTERIPVERTITDYYAVETQIEYIPKEIEETIVEYEPVERVWERVQYLPVETQIVHYPERDNYVAQPGKIIQGGYIESNQSVSYVPSQSGIRNETVYYTGKIPANYSEYQGGYTQGGIAQGGYTQGGYTQSGYTQGGYTQGGYVQGGSNTYNQGTTYTTGTYVTGGSGVRQGETTVYRTSNVNNGGYVTGGSGVRQQYWLSI